MRENLLWPTTTTTVTRPPQLLVDLFTLFNGKLGIFNVPLVGEYAPQSSNTKWTKYRLIDVSSDGSNTFRIGFVSEIIGGPPTYRHIIAVPFQDIDVSIDEFRCHGWNEAYADTLSNPTETEVKKTLANEPVISTYLGNPPDGHGSLFKMTGYKLDSGGSEQQFSSNGSYMGINYTFGSNYVNNLRNEFPNMWSKYQKKSEATLAVETVIKVKVHSGNTDNGFKIGIA